MTSPNDMENRKKKSAGRRPGTARKNHGDTLPGTGRKPFFKKQAPVQGHGLDADQEVLAGVHCVREALKAGKRKFHRVHLTDSSPRDRLRSIVEQAADLDIPVEILSSEALDILCPDVRHQGIVAVVGPLPLIRAETALSEMDKVTDGSFIVILESMEDPHNLGALIRTALCAGVDHIVLPRDRAASPTPAVSRASAGAMEHASIWSVTNTTSLIRSLKKRGFWVAGLDADGEQSVFQADLTGDIALVVGGEHKGIRPLVKKECDFILSLPMARGVTSLNASVAGGIAMYEVLRQRNDARKPQ
ncbi:23S rRNA (guanosine(2251)-2'-O)-methyltransferase RlmB [Desulfocicer niacini]